MRIKTILTIFVAVILVAVVALALILKSMDFSKYRGLIAEKVTETTGRELKIDGEFKVKLSFIPSLTVNDVTFANASWGSRPEMAKIKRLEVQVDLLPLLSGEIKVKRFVLVEPDILLETDATGRGNWVLGIKSKETGDDDIVSTKPKQDVIVPLVNEVLIKNASLTYRDGLTQKLINLSLNNFKAHSADMQSPFYLDIDGTYNNNRFEITSELGPLNRLISPTVPYPLHLEGQTVGTAIKIDGTVKTPLKGNGLDLTISAKGEELTKLIELAELSQVMGRTFPKIGPFDLAAQVSDPEGKFTVTDIKVALGKKDLAVVNVKGAIKDAMKGKGLDLAISASGEELTKLLELAELPQLKEKKLPQIGPFDISAHVANPGGKLSVTDINAAIGKEDLSIVKVKGAIKDAMKGKGLDLAISARGEELTKLVALAELPQLKEKKVPQIGPFDITAQVSDPGGKFSATNIEVALGKKDLAVLKVKGAIKDAMKGEGLDLAISASGEDLKKLLVLAELPQLKGKTVPQIGPFDISAHVANPGGKVSVTDIKAALGKNDFALVKINGVIKNAMEGKGLDLKLSVQGSDLAKVSKLAGVEAPMKGSFQLAAHLTDPKGTLFFKRLQLQFGQSNLAGTIAVKMTKHPAINASFTSLNLDLNEFKSPVNKKADKKKKSGQSGKSKKRVFSDEPFPIEALQTVNAKVKISKGRILSDGLELKDLVLDMNLKDGNLAVRPLMGSIAGTNFSADISLNTRQSKMAVVKTKMDIKKIDIARLLKDMKVTDLLSSGKLHLKADLDGRGDSLQTLMAGLNGNISLVMDEGKIENKYVDFIASDLVKLIVPGAMKKEYTMVNCFVSRFDIKNGLAENTGFLFDTDNITVAGDGNIDLSTEKLNLGLNPKPKHASLVSIAIPLNIRGTLAEPSIKPDTASVAKKVAGGILGSVINPVGILVPLVSKGTSDENPCLVALSNSKKTATTKPASQPKQEEKKPVDDLKDVLEGIGKGLGGLFK
tara:strand:+ start:6354 stop:9359 length:3006 start_codon:yes stop_codon:yes gene_type:complete